MTTREQLHEQLHVRIQILTPDCKDFQNDVTQLMQLDNNCSLPGITSSIWLDKLASLSDADFEAYGKRYTKGLLDPWTEH